MTGVPRFPGDVTEKESMLQSPMAPPAIEEEKHNCLLFLQCENVSESITNVFKVCYLVA